MAFVSLPNKGITLTGRARASEHEHCSNNTDDEEEPVIAHALGNGEIAPNDTAEQERDSNYEVGGAVIPGRDSE